MSKILYPIFKLPSENEDDVEYQAIPTWIKWWLLNNYNKKHSWVLSEIITGNPLTLENSVATKFYLPPLPRGNSEQVQYSGKNLYHNTLRTSESTITGVTITPNADGTITLNGTATDSGYINLDNKNYNSTIGTLFDVSTTRKSASNSDYTISCYITNGTLSAVAYDNNNKLTFAQLKNGQTYSNAVLYLQIEQGTTVTAYEPYCGGTASPNPSYPQSISNVTGDVEVLVQNKNKVDLSKSAVGQNIYASGTILDGSVMSTTDYIDISMFNDFTISVTDTTTGWNTCYFDEDKNVITGGGNGYTALTKTFNRPINAKYIRFSYKTDGVGVMLVGGSTAGSYVAHEEQTFTFPLGTQRMYLGDYLADDGIHHVRKQIVLDGSSDEDWSHYSNSSAPYRIVINDMKPSSSDNIIPNVKCTHFEAVEWNANFNNYTYLITMHLNNNYLAFRDTDITSLADWKTWLSNNNLIVEYLLEQEEIAPYTTEQQQAYDEIKQAISYEEQTNISGVSDESNPLFEVQYYMKNESEGE